MHFGERLAGARKNQNLSQIELAARSGVSARSIAAYETGKARPTPSKLEKLALALGVSTAWLMFGHQETHPASVLHDAPPTSLTPESVRLALRSLKMQTLSIVEQIGLYENQLCGQLNSGEGSAESEARKIALQAGKLVDRLAQSDPAARPSAPAASPPCAFSEETSSPPPPSGRPAKKRS